MSRFHFALVLALAASLSLAGCDILLQSDADDEFDDGDVNGGNGPGDDASPDGTEDLPTGTCDDTLILTGVIVDDVSIAVVEDEDCLDAVVKGHAQVQGRLEVGAGATVMMDQGSTLTIADSGSIKVEGTEEAPVHFVGAEPEPGYWEAIVVRSPLSQNVIRYANIDGGGSGDGYTTSRNTKAIVIVTSGGALTVENSTISNSAGVGLWVGDGSTLRSLKENLFAGNATYPARLPSDQAHYADASNVFSGGDDDNGNAAVRIGAGAVKGSVTWQALDVPYFIDGTITLDSGDANLTISPGAAFEMDNGAAFKINEGSFMADGTTDDGADVISFYGGSDESGYWEGIIFVSASRDNVLRHVSVADGGKGGSYGLSGNRKANVIVYSNSRLTIEDSSFHNSGGTGLMVEGSLTSFARNTFYGNDETPLKLPASQVYNLDSDSDYAGEEAEDANARDYIHVVGDSIERDGTWSPTNAPYRLFGHTLLNNEDSTLTVEAGVNIEMSEDAAFTIKSGTMSMEGTEEANINVSGSRGDAGHWEAFVFRSPSSDNLVSFTNFSDGGKGDSYSITSNTPASVIVANGGRLAVEDSSFSNSGDVGLHVSSDGTLVSFARNYFEANTGAPIRLPAGQVATLDVDTVFDGDEPNGLSRIRISGGTASATSSWGAFSVPLRVEEHIYFDNEDATFTLSPGLTVEFSEGRALVVEAGTFIAAGEAGDKITFRGAQNVVNYWEALIFRSPSSENLLEHVIVNHAGKGGNYSLSGSVEASILARGYGHVTLRDVTIGVTDGNCVGGGGTMTFEGDNDFNGCGEP